jgi:hypothetical protein
MAVAARRCMKPTARVAKISAGLLVLFGTVVNAQNTLDVVAQGPVSGISGLRAITIRDNQLSACYTLFILEQRTDVGVVTTADVATQQSLQRMREAADERDRRIAELNAATDLSHLNDYEQAVARAKYEDDRVRIDDQYEQALRMEIPGSYPWSSTRPGTKSGSQEDPANAVRRAVVDPNPTSTLLTQEFAELNTLIRSLIEAPRMTSSGPFACPPRNR